MSIQDRWWHLDKHRRTRGQQRFINVCLAASRLGNALAGGDPNTSISERVGEGAAKGDRLCRDVLAPLIDAITLEPGHCAKAVRDI